MNIYKEIFNLFEKNGFDSQIVYIEDEEIIYFKNSVTGERANIIIEVC